MIRIHQGAAMALALLLVPFADAQWANPSALEDAPAQVQPTPEPINLDIAPEDAAEPEELEEIERATFAVLHPQEFHEWLLEMEPGREARETFAAFAILDPPGFRRANPRSPEQLRAEAIAARAILYLLAILPTRANPN